MTLKTSHLQSEHCPHGRFETSFFRPACPEAATRWAALLISEEPIQIERDGDLMRLTARCDLPIMRLYAQGEPRQHASTGTDQDMLLDFDFIKEFSRLLAHGTTVEIEARCHNDQPWQYTVTPPLMN